MNKKRTIVAPIDDDTDTPPTDDDDDDDEVGIDAGPALVNAASTSILVDEATVVGVDVAIDDEDVDVVGVINEE
jgi:hypothetical protein